ncbi:hypothetical protein SDC9_48511 [bioreactor metagenome]|uniref:Uncharacterized protein n=1 Tax=bioreactor metagenome TaxID=1076179 RepID=A0A644WEI9_9ZZZZ
MVLGNKKEETFLLPLFWRSGSDATVGMLTSYALSATGPAEYFAANDSVLFSGFFIYSVEAQRVIYVTFSRISVTRCSS